MRKFVLMILALGLAAGPALAEDGKQAVPVKRVVLFSSGVGYFEHHGTVKGDATTELAFKAEQINDILKSLVVLDLDGGTISTVSYPTKDPLSRVLRSFQVDLSSNPSLHQLLNQLRGAEVHLWAPNEITGKVLGVESRRRDLPDGKGVIQEPILNLVTGDGTIQAISLLSVEKLKLADQKLAAEVNKALAALAAGRDRDKKPITLSFKGQGERRVVIGYIVETPIWQTSYRLLLDEEEKPLLQGWAILENTTDADWTEVSLSLVSGRPISFIQDLYTPLYVPRPVVQPELFASLRPRVYEEAEMADREVLAAGLEKAKAEGRARGLRRSLDSLDRAPAAPRPGRLRQAAQQSVQSMAGARKVGELFSYDIKTPVDLPRQRSAMLPIANKEIAGEKVSIYNASVQAKHPLNGFKLKNNTGLNLMGGPITVFDSGTYAGDARIDNLVPDDERLLSYALDLEVTVDSTKTTSTTTLLGVRLSTGVLVAKRKSTRTRTYVVKNKSKKDKVVLIEHPISSGWDLVKPAKPDEKTASLYRFRLKVPAGKSEALPVVEERPYDEHIALRSASISQLDYWVRQGRVSGAIHDALKLAIGHRRELADLEKQLRDRTARVAAITKEQGRIRLNMESVDRSSQYYKRLLKKLDDQETELEKLDGEIKELKDQISAKQKTLDAYLLKLTLK